MRFIHWPRGEYRPNPDQPPRPNIPQHPRRQLVLEITPDDGHFERLDGQEPPRSPRPLLDSKPKSTMTIFDRRMRKKGSLFAELATRSADDGQETLPTGDEDSGNDETLPLLNEDEEGEDAWVQDNFYDHIDIDHEDPSSALSATSAFPTSHIVTPTTPALLSNTTTPEAALSTPTGRIAKMMSTLSLESSRLEISLLALGILILVAQMGALIWIGLRRRRRSAQWHRKERQQIISDEHGQDQNVESNHLRFSSTVGLLLKSSFLASSSGGHGLDTAGMMPAFLKTGASRQEISSPWERFKARFGHRGATTEGASGYNTANRMGQDSCLFDEVFPPPRSNDSSIRDSFDVQGSPSSYFGPQDETNPLGGGGTGRHHHSLVLGPPTVIPVVVAPAPKSVSSSRSSGSLSTTASEFIDTMRRKSSAILAETIIPPVQVQMEVLTEIGRRVSATLQSSVGSVMLRGKRERRGTANENAHKKDDDDGGYSYSHSRYHGYGTAASGDDELSSSSNEGSVSATPPEERYCKDLEAGESLRPILRGSRGGEDAATASGATRRFSLNGLIHLGGSQGESVSGSEGLVRRANAHQRHLHRPPHKRVSFVEGLVLPLSSPITGNDRARSRGSSCGSGGRRHSSFNFLQRGSGVHRRPGDEEMGGQIGEVQHGDEDEGPMGYGERDRDQRIFHLV